MLMGLEFILVIGAIAIFAVWFNRSQGGNQQRGEESAEDVVRRRFAAGEIEAEEYEQRLAALRH
jgi:uncharacterized membrane protein